ncbi:MAG: YdcF family protein [Chloroflexota bacterium]|nr:YdcF family protein [Dehalococcoidia bacterium]MDW8253237.1 YdcF family protein [Chloroflexota bacterium]
MLRRTIIPAALPLLLCASLGTAAGAIAATPCGDPAPADAIVVLGASVWSGGRPSPALRERALRGAALWREGKAPYLVGSGAVGAHPPAEGAVIAQVAIAAGVPIERIFIEDRARSTEESAIFVRQLANNYGWQRLIVVSDPYHLPRAGWLFRDRGFIVETACSDDRVYRRETIAYQAAREVAGILFYASTRWLIAPGSF